MFVSGRVYELLEFVQTMPDIFLLCLSCFEDVTGSW